MDEERDGPPKKEKKKKKLKVRDPRSTDLYQKLVEMESRVSEDDVVVKVEKTAMQVYMETEKLLNKDQYDLIVDLEVNEDFELVTKYFADDESDEDIDLEKVRKENIKRVKKDVEETCKFFRQPQYNIVDIEEVWGLNYNLYKEDDDKESDGSSEGGDKSGDDEDKGSENSGFMDEEESLLKIAYDQSSDALLELEDVDAAEAFELCDERGEIERGDVQVVDELPEPPEWSETSSSERRGSDEFSPASSSEEDLDEDEAGEKEGEDEEESERSEDGEDDEEGGESGVEAGSDGDDDTEKAEGKRGDDKKDRDAESDEGGETDVKILVPATKDIDDADDILDEDASGSKILHVTRDPFHPDFSEVSSGESEYLDTSDEERKHRERREEEERIAELKENKRIQALSKHKYGKQRQSQGAVPVIEKEVTFTSASEEEDEDEEKGPEYATIKFSEEPKKVELEPQPSAIFPVDFKMPEVKARPPIKLIYDLEKYQDDIDEKFEELVFYQQITLKKDNKAKQQQHQQTSPALATQENAAKFPQPVETNKAIAADVATAASVENGETEFRRIVHCIDPNATSEEELIVVQEEVEVEDDRISLMSGESYENEPEYEDPEPEVLVYVPRTPPPSVRPDSDSDASEEEVPIVVTRAQKEQRAISDTKAKMKPNDPTQVYAVDFKVEDREKQLDEYIKKISALPGIIGIVVINPKGIALKSTVDDELTVHYATLAWTFVQDTNRQLNEGEQVNELKSVCIHTVNNRNIYIITHRSYTIIAATR